MTFRFNLKWMLVVVAIAGAAMALVTQLGMSVAEFEVWENNLRINDEGLVEGELHLGYEGIEFRDTGWSFECKMINVSSAIAVDLKPGSKAKVRYRAIALGPLKQQNPCARFLTGNLGIDQTDIVGYVTFKGGTGVVINGRK